MGTKQRATAAAGPRTRSAYEQSAIDDLLSALRGHGNDARDLGAPDLDNNDPLNVDARFDIDGNEWAVEHIRVVYDSAMIPAHEEARRELETRLGPLAFERGARVGVALYPPRRSEGKPLTRDFYSSLVDRGRRAILDGADDLEGDTRIYVRSGDPGVDVYLYTSDDASMHNQLVKGLKEAIDKKKGRQFCPAKKLGLPVLLLADQSGDPASEALPQWNYSHDLLRAVLRELVPESEGLVDEIWVRRPDGECSRLDPAEPEEIVDGLEYLWQ